MAGRLDRKWCWKMQDQIKDKTFKSKIVRHDINAKWLIGHLADRDIPFKIINLGAGVKRIIIAEHICPTCGGKGYVEKEETNA